MKQNFDSLSFLNLNSHNECISDSSAGIQPSSAISYSIFTIKKLTYILILSAMFLKL